ncbi:MAG: AtpZ/AtpI family protein [Draconibacterium sp.]|nr:AtpZ/AtpI family protein [Draconibacterium sp.]
MKQPKNKKRKDFGNFIRFSSLGFEMMVIIGLGTFGGYKLDQWMENSFKGFTLGLMILSVILAIIHGTRNLLKK